MEDINVSVITGNLTRDCEKRATPSGYTVVNFSVAVNGRKKNQQTGQWEDKPNYIDCTMFGDRAGALEPYLTKGSRVSVEGSLNWHQWEKDGQKRSKVDLIVRTITFMNGRSKQVTTEEEDPDAYSDEDIPF